MRSGRLDVASIEAVGARSGQEDFALHVPLSKGDHDVERLLVIVADGMGGHAAGEVASRTAVEAFLEDARERRSEPSADILAFGLAAASNAVQSAALADPALADMGTTLLAGIVERAEGGAVRLFWISIGDSPLWLVNRRGATRRLNEDHSLAGELERELRQGRISRRDAAQDSRRQQSNILTQVLSVRSAMGERPDFRRTPLTLSRGDVILFATDGVETLSEQQIGTLACKARPDGAEAIVKGVMQAVLAAEAPRQDNATIVAVTTAGDRPLLPFWPF